MTTQDYKYMPLTIRGLTNSLYEWAKMLDLYWMRLADELVLHGASRAERIEKDIEGLIELRKERDEAKSLKELLKICKKHGYEVRVFKDSIHVSGYKEWIPVCYMRTEESRMSGVKWVIQLIERGTLKLIGYHYS